MEIFMLILFMVALLMECCFGRQRKAKDFYADVPRVSPERMADTQIDCSAYLS